MLGLGLWRATLERLGLRYFRAERWELSVKLEFQGATPLEGLVVKPEQMPPEIIKCAKELELRRKDVCLVARLDGKVVGRVWLALGRRVYVPEFEKWLDFGRKTAYIYGAEVLKPYRGRGIFSELLGVCIGFAKSKGYSRIEIITANPRVKRALLHRGFRLKSRIWHWRFFCFQGFRELRV